MHETVGASKRPYDATRRQERAERQRAQTRDRVLRAAGELFLSQGYARTTMTEVARAASVSVQTVYMAAGAKVDLLRAVTAAAVTGGDPDEVVLEQPWVAAYAAAPDGLGQLRVLVRGLVDLAERAAPLWRSMDEAAADDPGLVADLREHEAGRLRDQRALLGLLSGLVMPVDRAVDLLNAFASPHMWQLLVVERGWSRAEAEAMLLETLALHLLGQRTSASDERRT